MTAQQKPMNNFKRLLSALLCVVLLSTCVYAGEINPGKTCGLTVRCKHTVEDVSYAIWRVAEVDADEDRPAGHCRNQRPGQRHL